MNFLLENMHFILTHFPIVLLIVGFLFDLLARILKKKEWHSAGWACLALGTLGAIASVMTGPALNGQSPDLPAHELFGRLTAILAIVLFVVRLAMLRWKKREIGSHPAFLIGALAAAILVGYTGHLGGKMVHETPEDAPAVGMQGGQGGPAGAGGETGGPSGLNGPEGAQAVAAAANP